MNCSYNRSSIVALAVLVFVGLGMAFSGGAAAEILDSGAANPSEGPALTEWNPQLVNSSTLDTYQVTIQADNPAEGITLIRQRPQETSTVTQRITMHEDFGDAINPAIVAFEGDDGPQERLEKEIFVDNGDVVVILSDSSQGAQQQAILTGITIQFQAASAATPGFYNFSVDMQGQETIGVQTGEFTTLEATGVAQVEVVDAEPATEDDLAVAAVDTAAEATQDERALAVTATIENPTGDERADMLVYGLVKDGSPVFDGTDLLTQQQNVTVEANSQETVTFFVDLTEQDEAIDTGDDITHGVSVLDSEDNATAALAILDGPVSHYTDAGATFNRTTGLIQTGADIASDADQDVLVVSYEGSPYGEHVVVDATDVLIRGNTTLGMPAVAWADTDDPVFDIITGTDNVTISDLRIDALNPDNMGVRFNSGIGHNVSGSTIAGTAQGETLEWGVFLSSNADYASVQHNHFANLSQGVNIGGDFATVSSNTVTELAGSSRGIHVVTSGHDAIIESNTLEHVGMRAILVNGPRATVADNDLSDTGGQAISLGNNAEETLVIGNTIVGDGTGDGIRLDGVSNNTLRENFVTGVGGHGFSLVNGATDNTLSNNTAIDNVGVGHHGYLLGSVTGNHLSNNTAQGNVADGFRLDDASDNVFTDNVAEGNDAAGFHVVGAGSGEESNENTFANDTAVDNQWAFIINGEASDNDVSALNIGNSTAANTTLSFEAENVRLSSASTPPADPASMVGIDRYFAAADIGVGAVLNVSVHYEDPADIMGVQEDTLEILRYNGTDWVAVDDAGVDTDAQVVFADISEFSTFGAFGDALEDPAPSLSDLDIATEGDDAVVAGGADRDITVNVTNLGTEEGEFEITLTIDDTAGFTQVDLSQTVTVDGGETEMVTYAAATADLDISPDPYDVTVSADDDSIAGVVRVHPDVNGDGNPARDTTGDGLLNDIDGDGSFDIVDVQVLFTFLNSEGVQTYAYFFDFATVNDERTTVFDIQALFVQLQAQN